MVATRCHLSRAVALGAAVLMGSVMYAGPGNAGTLPTVETVLTGLENPRGVAVGDDGSVYVAEAGSGGSTLAEALVEGEPGWVCVGHSAGVTRIDRRGRVVRFGGLPSTAGAGGTAEDPSCAGSGFAAVGAHDVAVSGRGNLAVTIGLGGDEATRGSLPADFATRLGTLEHLPPSGRSRTVADLVAFEEVHNPDGEVPDSNPYGTDLLPDGSRLVVDAGGNSLLRVWPDGFIETVASFGRNFGTTVPALSCGPIPGFPPPGVPIPAQAVPTTVVARGDHAYVGFLGGFPFTPGMTRIVTVDLVTGEVALVADGLTTIVGLDVAADGTVYAIEMVATGLLEGEICGNFEGRLVRISDGVVSEVDIGQPLIAPGGVAVARDGTVYVSTGSIFPGFVGGGALIAIRWD